MLVCEYFGRNRSCSVHESPGKMPPLLLPITIIKMSAYPKACFIDTRRLCPQAYFIVKGICSVSSRLHVHVSTVLA